MTFRAIFFLLISSFIQQKTAEQKRERKAIKLNVINSKRRFYVTPNFSTVTKIKIPIDIYHVNNEIMQSFGLLTEHYAFLGFGTKSKPRDKLVKIFLESVGF